MRLSYCDQDVWELGEATLDGLPDNLDTLHACKKQVVHEGDKREVVVEGLSKKKDRPTKGVVRLKSSKCVQKTKKKTNAQETLYHTSLKLYHALLKLYQAYHAPFKCC